MGSRDIKSREKKKQKKDAKKAPIIGSLEAPRQEVEIIRKHRKEKEPEEEE